MTVHYVLDAKGDAVPCNDLERWRQFFETSSRVVERTTIGPYEVSTVFLSLDHGWGEGHPPVLWETMVFNVESSEEALNFGTERYTSRHDAIAGHAAKCDEVRRALLT